MAGAELDGVTWATCLGSDDGESVHSVALSPDRRHLAVVAQVSLPLPDNPLSSDRSLAHVWLLDAESGATVWDRRISTDADAVYGQSAVFRDDSLLVVAGGYEGDADPPELRVTGLDVSSGSTVYDSWPEITPAYPYAMTLANDGALAVVGTASGTAGISTHDGNVLWQRPLPGSPWQLHTEDGRIVASGFAEGGWVAVMGADGSITWEDADTGQLTKSNAGAGLLALVGGTTDTEAEVRLHDLATGEPLWSERITFDINAGPSIGIAPEAGMVAVVSAGEATGLAIPDGRTLWTGTAHPCCDAVTDGGRGTVLRATSGPLAIERYDTNGVLPPSSVDGVEHDGSHPRMVVDAATGTAFASFSVYEGSAILTGTILVVRTEPE